MKKSSARKSLLMSILAMLFSISMFAGTTFAWFTDSVTSSNNRIVAGNLDVDLLMYKQDTDSTYKYLSIAGGSGDVFNEANNANSSPASLWEPGKTQVVYLGVKNAGTLALKYNVILDVTDEDASDNVNLADVLDFAIVPGAQAPETTYANWDAVKAAAPTTNVGVIGTLMGDENPARITAAPNGTLDEIAHGTVDEIEYFALAVHMQEDAGNEYQGKGIIIDVSVVATQKDAESDSFGPDYDETSTYPVIPTTMHDIKTATVTEAAITEDTATATYTATVQLANTELADVLVVNSVDKSVGITLTNYSANASTTDTVTSLTRTIDTKDSSTTGVTFDISFTATVTKTESVGEQSTTTKQDYEVHTFDKVLTNVVNIGAGLTGVKVTHGDDEMDEVTSTSDANYGADGYYYYNSTTGDLTIWSSTYSAYSIVWDAPTFVARIGTTGYTTLKAAIDAAKAGDAIVVVKDFNLANAVAVEKNIALNLDGHTITVTGTDAYPFLVYGATFTVNGLNGTTRGKIVVPETNDNVTGIFRLTNASAQVTGNESLAISGLEISGKFNNKFTVDSQNRAGVITSMRNQIDSVTIDNCVIIFEETLASTQVANTKTSFISLGGSSSLTIKDSTLTFNSPASSYRNLIDGLGNNSSVIIKDSTVVTNQPSFNPAGAINIELYNVTIGTPSGADWISTAVPGAYGNTVTINGGSYKGQNCVYIWTSGGTATIEDGSFEGTDTVLWASGANNDPNQFDANITVNGGTFDGKIKVVGTANQKANITINAGTFTHTSFEGVDANGTIVIKGGTFDANPSAYVANGYVALDNGNDTWTVVPGALVSNESELGTAINSLTEGTIYLKNDIEVSSSINVSNGFTLDLNGKTITSSAVLFNSYGNNAFIIKDSSVAQTGAIDVSADKIVYVSKGKLTLESGNLTVHSSQSYTYGIQVGSSGSFEMTGGSITIPETSTSTYNYCVSNSGGTVNISGGELIAKASGGNYAVNNTSGTVTITGGKVEAYAYAAGFKSPYVLYITGGTCNVTNGYFRAIGDANTYSAGYLVDGSGTVSISGGYFGGNYFYGLSADYIAENYESINNTDETTKTNYKFVVVAKEAE